MNDWKVMVINGHIGAMQIILYRRKEGSTFESLYYENGERKFWEWNGCSLSADYKPLFTIPYDLELESNFSKQLLQALVDRGIQLPDKNFSQGKLEATEKHLEDMRKLVFDAG